MKANPRALAGWATNQCSCTEILSIIHHGVMSDCKIGQSLPGSLAKVGVYAQQVKDRPRNDVAGNPICDKLHI
jgi:hypothetical protein